MGQLTGRGTAQQRAIPSQGRRRSGVSQGSRITPRALPSISNQARRRERQSMTRASEGRHRLAHPLRDLLQRLICGIPDDVQHGQPPQRGPDRLRRQIGSRTCGQADAYPRPIYLQQRHTEPPFEHHKARCTRCNTQRGKVCRLARSVRLHSRGTSQLSRAPPAVQPLNTTPVPPAAKPRYHRLRPRGPRQGIPQNRLTVLHTF